jgi:hypothetical protein
MKTKTNVKAGRAKPKPNHNEAQVRDAAPGLKTTTIVKAGMAVAGLKVRTNLKAGKKPRH